MSVCLIYKLPIFFPLSRFLSPLLQHLFNFFPISSICFITSQDFLKSHLPWENLFYFNPTVQFIRICILDGEDWGWGWNHTIKLIGIILIKLPPDSRRTSFYIFLLQLSYFFSTLLKYLGPWSCSLFWQMNRFFSIEISTRELCLHIIAKLQTFFSSFPSITNKGMSSLELKNNLSISASNIHPSGLLRKLNPFTHSTNFYTLAFKYTEDSLVLNTQKKQFFNK